MKLFALPDGTVDRLDRAQWLTVPFDLSFAEGPPPPVVIARQGTGERRHAYDLGDDDSAPPRRIIRIPQAKKPDRKPHPATTVTERTPRPAPIPLWAEPKRDIVDADFERPSRWNAAQDEDELLLLGVL